MQLILLGLALAIFLHDAPEFAGYSTMLPLPSLAGVVLAPKLTVGGLYWLACFRARRRIGKPRGLRGINRVNRLAAVLPVFALGSFITDLWAGALWWLRGVDETRGVGVRDLVLLDELGVMLPTLGLLAFGYWAYYPIDRRLRESTILRNVDLGLPIYPVWSRGEYVWTQLRNQFAMVLGPLLVIMAWSETLVKLNTAGTIGDTVQLWLMPGGAAVAFVFAPLMMCRLWDTVPLPAGPTRDNLTAMCERHGVVVRDLLLWRTFGGMINAAVMGLFGRVRFILLSDGLLDQVPQREVEAVMAHELAHVRLKHLWWLLVSAGAGLMVLSAAGEALLRMESEWPMWFQAIAYAAGVGLWALQFGWVSRRIERQADTFAARHMARVYAEGYNAPEDHQTAQDEMDHCGGRDDPARSATHFDVRSVGTMIRALQHVADLNHIATGRRSWRHGSIAWRQAYLHQLIGTPITDPPIDRLMRRVNAASLLILIASVGWTLV